MIARARRTGWRFGALAALIWASEGLTYAAVQVAPAWLAYGAASLIMAAIGAVAFELLLPTESGALPGHSAAPPVTPVAMDDAAAELAGVRLALADQQEWHRRLRHDLRGILSPALLTADRLLANEDPKVQRAGNIMVQAVERAAALLAKNDRPASPQAADDSPSPAGPGSLEPGADSPARPGQARFSDDR